jgi:hypothetical protein
MNSDNTNCTTTDHHPVYLPSACETTATGPTSSLRSNLANRPYAEDSSFIAESKRQTQRARILALLISSTGWISLPELLALAICRYSARIFELRRQGYLIEMEFRTVGGRQISFYRLQQPALPFRSVPGKSRRLNTCQKES